MTTTEQLQTVTDKLAALEAHLQSQTKVGAGGSPGNIPGQITFKVPWERKLSKFVSSHDDHLIEDWILEAERAIAGHQDGAAKEEVRLRPPEQRFGVYMLFNQ